MATTIPKSALIIVDLQEDFCPPNGSLAVSNGRDIIPTVNALLELPFTLRIATKDWHPPDHISFASNHPNAQPFTSTTTVVNPNNKDETYETRLWPIHCVQNTPGAELVPELHQQKLDTVIEKGQRKEIEMYSAFYDPLKSPRCADSGLADILRRGGVDQVFVAGLAADYCVKATALDAQREGFKTFIVEEGTRAVDAGGWADVRKGIEAEGVEIISFDSQEVRSVGKV